VNTANLIGRANGVKHLYNSNGNTHDIIQAIMYADKFCAPYTVNAAKTLQGRNTEETCYNIWKFWKDNVKYVEDPDGYQFVKSPGYAFETGQTKGSDCKSYSVACASMLQNLGIPYVYRFITEDAGKEFHHVYVVVQANGQEIILDCVLNQFNRQNAYARKKDLAPKHAKRAAVGRIGLTATEARDQTWIKHEQQYKGYISTLLSNIIGMIDADVDNKYSGPVKRKALKKALYGDLQNLIKAGAVLIYCNGDGIEIGQTPEQQALLKQGFAIWDDSKAIMPDIEPNTGANLKEKRITGNGVYAAMLQAGLRIPTIKAICELGVYNAYSISLPYMLYRCYCMVKYGQPWEPVPGLPFFNYRTNEFDLQGTDRPEMVAAAYQIGTCFPATGGTGRPYGQPYQSIAGWIIRNGADDVAFAKWKAAYKPCPKSPLTGLPITDAICTDYEIAQTKIMNNGAGLPEEQFAANYQKYQQWMNGNMVAIPSFTYGSNVSAIKGIRGGKVDSHVGEISTALVTLILGIISAVIALVAGIIKAVTDRSATASQMPNTNYIPNPPPDFSMQYTTVDGCFIGSAPTSCGSLMAKYCQNGSFTCLTTADLARPENQQGAPAGGFLAGLGESKWLLFGGAALIGLGLFMGDKD
jgi:hypothetical protein